VQYVELPETQELNDLRKGGYTLMAWVRPTIYPASSAVGNKISFNDCSYAVLMEAMPHPVGLRLRGNDRSVYAQEYRAPDKNLFAISSAPFELRAWQHVAQVVSPLDGAMRLYVNGQLSAETSFSRGSTDSHQIGSMWRIGVSSPESTGFRWAMDGAIDDVRIFNSDLHESVIRGLADPDLLPELLARSAVNSPQPVTVSGRVTEGNLPVAGAAVLFESVAMQGVACGSTDASGRFALKTLAISGAFPGQYRVTITYSREGVPHSKTYASPVTVVDAEDFDFDFEL
jgi:hypothetical protein